MTLRSSEAISVRAADGELIEGVCRAADCSGAESGIPLGALLLSLVLAIGLLATLRHVAKAQTLVETEQERVRDERDAFADFQRRVADLEAVEPISTPTERNQAVTPPTGSGQLDRIKDAYRETVMAVDHYEEEYDEPIEVNMTAELGEGAASAVFDSGAFTNQLQGGLRQQCAQARRKRDKLLDLLDSEEQRLQNAADSATEIETELETARPSQDAELSFDDLLDRWQRLGTLESRASELLAGHQRPARLPSGNGSDEGLTLREYLYQPLTTDHPVLYDTTNLLDRIRGARRRTLRLITTRA